MQRTTIWIPIVVIALLFSPIALTGRSFGHDWTLHLWLVRQQQLNIQTMGHPGLFVSAAPIGVFYPVFAFVGSGIYALGGALAIVFGNRPIVAYKSLYLLGICLAYGGMTWLAVQLGLRSWRSQMPGLVFVTGSYFITDMLGRGDLGEFLALAAIPFVIAALTAVVTAPQLRLRYLLALVLAIFVFTGSHNITLLWGGLFLVLLGVLVLAALAPRITVEWRRVGGAVGAAAIGAGLNAWYLLADTTLAFHTRAAQQNEGLPRVPFRSLWGLIDPLRPTMAARPSYAVDIRLALPWIFVVWAVFVLVLTYRRQTRASRVLSVGLMALGAGFMVLILDRNSWRVVPTVFRNVQFTWRLHAYVLLVTGLLVLSALRSLPALPTRHARIARLVLAACVLFTVPVATWQAWRVRSEYITRTQVTNTARGSFVDAVVADRSVLPDSWYDDGQFRDASLPLVQTRRSRLLVIPPASVAGNRFSGMLDVPDGPAPFATNINAGPDLITMAGIKPIGRSASDQIVAVRASSVPPTGPVLVTITPARTLATVAGPIITILSVIALGGLVVVTGLRRYRRRERAASPTEKVRT